MELPAVYHYNFSLQNSNYLL